MEVLRGTLDRGPMKHRIGSCIWDNVKDPLRSFGAPFVLMAMSQGVWSVPSEGNNCHSYFRKVYISNVRKYVIALHRL